MPKVTKNEDDTSVFYSANEVETFKSDHGESRIPVGSIEFLFSNATGELLDTLGAMIPTGKQMSGDLEHGGLEVETSQQYTGADLDSLASDAKQLTGL